MSLILDGTNGLSDVDGSAATPAIRGSDANTGVFFGTDIVGVSTGGTERVRVDASGNVGIGTSSPTTTLDVGGLVRSFVSGGSTRFVSTDGTVEARFGTFTTPIAYVGTQSNHPFAFYTNGSERARIDSSGNLLVGTTSNDPRNFASGSGAKFGANGSLELAGGADNNFINITAASGNMLSFRRQGGTVGNISTNGSSTTYATSSDYRLKHDIQPMTGALAKVAQLKPVTYKWNADDSQSQGFIAHELQEVVPECVVGEKDAVDAEGNPQYQGIDTSFLSATLTAALQELHQIVQAQAAEIAELKAKLP
jgi:hypothetical protein